MGGGVGGGGTCNSTSSRLGRGRGPPSFQATILTNLSWPVPGAVLGTTDDEQALLGKGHFLMAAEEHCLGKPFRRASSVTASPMSYLHTTSHSSCYAVFAQHGSGCLLVTTEPIYRAMVIPTA